MLFDFMDTVTDLKSKEIKRATLNELVDYVSTNRGVLVEPAYPEITDMVRTHTHMHGNNKPLGCLTFSLIFYLQRFFLNAPPTIQ